MLKYIDIEAVTSSVFDDVNAGCLISERDDAAASVLCWAAVAGQMWTRFEVVRDQSHENKVEQIAAGGLSADLPNRKSLRLD